ncbi:MAG: ammonia-forming cytochrome c nitrite reductase subunit c552 [Planctomycetes bacterium]|nr:ammonia-forming cytochrome c nitrite reductase subunit c552 [Planctomycetota bacterium]
MEFHWRAASSILSSVKRRSVVAGVAALLAALAGLFFLLDPREEGEESGAPPGEGDRYAGSASCRECHEEAHEAWQASHHARAERALDFPDLSRAFGPERTVRVGTRGWVLGEKDGAFEFRTEGPGGKVETFRPVRAIGVDPLWQLLVEARDGRCQVTSLAYDPAREEWFSIFGEEDRSPLEWGSWAGRGMTWNTMCAACHNTGLVKGYDPDSDRFATRSAERGVGCEACHGPSLAHVEGWRGLGSRGPGERPAGTGSMERVAREFLERDRPEAGAWSPYDRALDTCGSCHARREDLTGAFRPGERFLDHYRPELPGLGEAYHADGQVREEDYEYVSFLGSRMVREGVRCVSCHEPHSGKTRERGNALCLACHKGKIDPGPHSHHEPGRPGGECVDCHMPITTYMARHPRHDHGFTIPDPLLTKELGIPNACNRCHADRDAEWALAAAEDWYGQSLVRPARRRARTLARASGGDGSVVPDLVQIARDDPSPLWRAVAAGALAPWVEREPLAEDLLAGALGSPDPLARYVAVTAIDPVAGRHAGVVRALLNDPVRIVRVGAAWTLRRSLDPENPAGRELLDYLRASSDHPVGAVRIASYHKDRGELPEAVRWIRHALRLEPGNPELLRALASLLSEQGDEEGAREAMEEYRRAARGGG